MRAGSLAEKQVIEHGAAIMVYQDLHEERNEGMKE